MLKSQKWSKCASFMKNRQLYVIALQVSVLGILSRQAKNVQAEVIWALFESE